MDRFHKFKAKLIVRVRSIFGDLIRGFSRAYWRLCGMKIGRGTSVASIYVTWPHQVSIGGRCKIEHGTYFKYDGIYSRGPGIVIGDNVFVGSHCEFNVRRKITIGSDSLLASGCKFIDHDHGLALSSLMGSQPGKEAEITIGPNVWLGANVVVLKGVNIATGAIVAAGAVVIKDVPADEIWGGVPARKIRDRS